MANSIDADKLKKFYQKLKEQKHQQELNKVQAVTTGKKPDNGFERIYKTHADELEVVDFYLTYYAKWKVFPSFVIVGDTFGYTRSAISIMMRKFGVKIGDKNDN